MAIFIAVAVDAAVDVAVADGGCINDDDDDDAVGVGSGGEFII